MIKSTISSNTQFFLDIILPLSSVIFLVLVHVMLGNLNMTQFVGKNINQIRFKNKILIVLQLPDRSCNSSFASRNIRASKFLKTEVGVFIDFYKPKRF